MTASRRYVRAAGVVVRRIAGETVLVPVSAPAGADAAAARFFVLNPTAEFIWEKLETAQTVSSLARQLTSQFEIDTARAQADVLAFLADLERRGAVTTEDE